MIVFQSVRCESRADSSESGSGETKTRSARRTIKQIELNWAINYS